MLDYVYTWHLAKIKSLRPSPQSNKYVYDRHRERVLYLISDIKSCRPGFERFGLVTKYLVGITAFTGNLVTHK